MKRKVAPIILTLASTVLGLTLAEAVARHTYGSGFLSVVDPYEHHPYRPYARYSDAYTGLEIVTNSLGWKDETARRIAARFDGLRIVVLGDSFAEGLGLPAKDTVAAQLETTLRPRLARPIEALNGGRVSYSPLLELQRARRFFDRGHATDFAVVLLDTSDAQDELSYRSEYDFAPDGSPLRLRSGAWPAPVRWVYNHSALLRSLRRLQQRARGGASSTAERAHAARPLALSPASLERLRRPEAISEQEYESLDPDARAILRPLWVDHAPSAGGWAAAGLHSALGHLDRLDRLCRDRGVRLFVAVYPLPQHLPWTAESYPAWRARSGKWLVEREQLLGTQAGSGWFAYRDLVLAWGQAEGVPVIDLSPAFADPAGWDAAYLPGDVHWSAEGSRRVAERIAAEVEGALGSRYPASAGGR